LETIDRSFEFDVIVYSTGFDSFTGAFDRIDITGIGGRQLRDKWADGPVTYLGTMVHGFPNLLMLAGPQTAATNFPRGAELAVNWVTPLLQYMQERGYSRFDAEESAEATWLEHVKEMYKGLLLRKAKSWITGYNSNIDGHEYGKTRYNIYNGGGPKYAERLKQVASNDYQGIRFRTRL
jgi:cation diffusion facilitator CzcD-associated flavoprotein CzcO